MDGFIPDEGDGLRVADPVPEGEKSKRETHGGKRLQAPILAIEALFDRRSFADRCLRESPSLLIL